MQGRHGRRHKARRMGRVVAGWRLKRKSAPPQCGEEPESRECLLLRGQAVGQDIQPDVENGEEHGKAEANG